MSWKKEKKIFNKKNKHYAGTTSKSGQSISYFSNLFFTAITCVNKTFGKLREALSFHRAVSCIRLSVHRQHIEHFCSLGSLVIFNF